MTYCTDAQKERIRNLTELVDKLYNELKDALYEEEMARKVMDEANKREKKYCDISNYNFQECTIATRVSLAATNDWINCCHTTDKVRSDYEQAKKDLEDAKKCEKGK